MNNPNSDAPNVNSFDKQIEAAFQRLEALEQQVREAGDVSPEPHRTLRLELLEELAIALEELQVAGEELHEQNEALATAQQTLEAERQRYRDLFEFAPDGYLVTDAGGVIQEANDAAAALFNRAQKFLGGKPLVLFVAKEDRQTFLTHLSRLQEAAVDRPEGWELSIQPYHRSPFPAALTVVAIRDATDQDVTLRWLIRGITKRKQMEEALRRANETLEQQVAEQTAELRQEHDFISAVLDTAGGLVIVLDTQERIVRVNRACEQLTGYTYAELQGKRVWELLLLPEEVEPVKAVFEQLCAGQFPNKYENHWVAKDGSRHLIAWSNTVLLDAEGGVGYVIGTGIDITEHKQAEEEIERSHRWLERIAHTTPDIIFVLDIINNRNVYTNRSILEILGYAPEEVGKLPAILQKFIAPDDLLQTEEFYGNMADADPGEVRLLTHRALHQDGTIRWIENRVTPFTWDESGNLREVIGLAHDITERRQMEEALKRHGRVLDNMAEGVIVTGEDDIIYFTNPAFDAMFGYEPGELSGQTASVLNLQPARTAAQFTTEIIPALQNSGVWSGEFNNRKKDGSPFITAAHVSRLETPDKAFLISVEEDITERKRMELEQAQLFEQVSTQRAQLRALTARLVETQEAERKAIARELHDQMGQNLTALDLNLNIIQRQISEASPHLAESIQSYLDDSLALVEHVGTRIRDIMANLRPPILDDYGLVAALRWYGSSLAPRVDFTITVQGDQLTPRLASPVELALFRIAQEALTNVTRHAQASQAAVSVEVDNGTVRLVVADDGLGFEFEGSKSLTDRQRWGLITMAERAEAVGGRFRFESRPGQGTQVIVEVRHSQRGEE